PWSYLLLTSGRQAVVDGISHSPEAYSVLIRDWYMAFLGRAAGAREVMPWAQWLASGATGEQVLASFLSSPEFFQRAGAFAGSTPSAETFVRVIYTQFLNRQPAAFEVSEWSNAVL